MAVSPQSSSSQNSSQKTAQQPFILRINYTAARNAAILPGKFWYRLVTILTAS
jgi:hypothetical protein